MDHINLQLLGMFLDFADIALIIEVCRNCLRIRAKINVPVIDDVRQIQDF